MNPVSTLDNILSLQLTVAWAGEGLTDPARLGWWRTALDDRYGGHDLLARLCPETWRWAVFVALRQVATRADATARSRDAEADRSVSLFHWPADIEQALSDRLATLMRTEPDPRVALPKLAITTSWNPATFREWLAALPAVDAEPTPAGRRLRGAMPASVDLQAEKLVAALAPVPDVWPAPHWKTR